MRKKLSAVFVLALLSIQLSVHAANKPGVDAVASAHPLATEAGLQILAEGGNAFDAAVAVTSTLAVVEPTGSGLGGGGFWLLHRASDGLQTFVDGRETAPAAAHQDMYLDADGKAIREASLFGPLAAGIPGEPAAIVHLATRYGQLPLAQSLKPAIKAAREGFACDKKLAHAFDRHWSRLSPAAHQVFGRDGRAPREGEQIVQAELAIVLQRLAEQGLKGFYEGKTAQALVAGSDAAGGIWTLDDLSSYKLVEREPAVTMYQGIRVISAPPPSAGGITLAQILGQLESRKFQGGNLMESRHLLIESMRRAYRDRAAFLGDADFVDVPQKRLMSPEYAKLLAESIDDERATPSASLPPAKPSKEGEQTTHFSILDREGNRVAATLSINLPFGSGYMAPGTGVFFNDEMDDFSASLDASNAYGLTGSRPNLVAAGKRPLSSMSPTFAEGPRGLLILGTPGGSRIITMVLHGLLAWAEGADVEQLVSLKRYHHQYLPDVVQFEPGTFSDDEQDRLKAMGHALAPLDSNYGNMQAITWDAGSGQVNAAADPRGVGSSRVQSGEH
tara:strand:+ start:4991 stop:6670 length:1680 start_codon:yes stop_codon:yes gene_type:complete